MGTISGQTERTQGFRVKGVGRWAKFKTLLAKADHTSNSQSINNSKHSMLTDLGFAASG